MVKCMRCGVKDGEIELRYARLILCNECFIEYFIERVRKTVEKYKMFNMNEKIGVAYQGDNKSLVLIDALRNAYPDMDIHILYVNLGTTFYTVDARIPLDEIANKYGMEVHIFSLPDEKGYTIEDFKGTKYWRKICSTCGILKRYYTGYLASRIGLDAVATSHTLDDVIEVMFTLFVDGKFEDIPSIKPVLHPEFRNQVRRIKPFIRTYEWEVYKYQELKGLTRLYEECPLKKGARSTWRKRLLYEFEEYEPAFMRKLFRVFTKKLTPLIEEVYEKPKLVPCKICGGPSMTGICGKCVREIYLRDRKNLDIKIG